MRSQTFQLLILTLVLACSPLLMSASATRATRPEPQVPGATPRIQVALLLDTSGSMDGLIEQAKSKLWAIINELVTARYEGLQPNIEIALYEYGNDKIPAAQNYVRQVLPLTGDLDKVSEELFKLQTYGGEEYCGAVIKNALTDLNWGGGEADLKLIYIAGNEPFNQGSVDYKVSCASAKGKNVIVNAIYCGNYDEGMRTFWYEGAQLAAGSYINIDHNANAVFIATPYDDTLSMLNTELNGTYIAYGYEGEVRRENQMAQDKNAAVYGSANMAERVAAKSSGAYKNTSWDLVDAVAEENLDVKKLKDNELPAELKGKSPEEIKVYVEIKGKEREAITARIGELNRKRVEYIAEQQKLAGSENTLEKKLLENVREQAIKKNYTF